jgi:hypothetical protein
VKKGEKNQIEPSLAPSPITAGDLTEPQALKHGLIP